MSKGKTILGALLALSLIYIGLPHLLPPATVEYHGETIQLARWYWSYDDYKYDAESIPAHELGRVQSMVLAAPVKAKCRDFFEMASEVSRISFPGFGSSSFGERVQANGILLAGFSVEIPGASRDRVFVFHKVSDGYALVDDFVAANEPGILGLRLEPDALVFTAFGGKELLRRSVPAILASADSHGRLTNR